MRFANLASALLLTLLPFAPTVFGQQETTGLNAITYPLTETVDTSKPFTITWKPDTKGTVTIELLKGPQKNLATILTVADSIKNTGSFTWDVPKSLEDESTMGSDIYGFRIIDDVKGGFEYSNPFSMKIPGSTYVDPSKPTEDEEEDKDKDEEEDKTTSTTATSTKTTASTTSTPSTTSTTSSTRSTTSTTEKPTSTSTTSTEKPTTTKTSTTSTSTEEEPTPTPEPTEDTNAQQTEAPEPTPTAEPAKEEKKEKGNPLGIPIIAWVGIGIGGLFALLILTYCVSLGVRNSKLRKEERERALMPTDIKPTQASGPYKQLDDDLEKAVLAETKGAPVPYGPTAFVSNQRDTTTSSNYSNQRGNNIEMSEYGNQQGQYYEEQQYNQNYAAPTQAYGGQQSFRDPHQQPQQYRGVQQGYPSTNSNGAFPEHHGNYPSQQHHYNGGNGGNGSYRY